MNKDNQQTSGVRELIAQIREEGVTAAQQEAEKILREAKDKATRMVENAKAEAAELQSRTRRELEEERAAALEALKVAARDTVLRLVGDVMTTFETYVKRLVSARMQDEDFLRQIILTVAARGAKNIKPGEAIEILLSPESLRKGGNDANAEEVLRQFILKISSAMLEEGVELKPVKNAFKGIRIKFKEGNLEIDLTEKAVGELLAQYLLPRFRNIVKGLD